MSEPTSERKLLSDTHWMEGDRVRNRVYPTRGEGVVVHVSDGSGALFGIQVIEYQRADGEVITAFGTDLEDVSA